MAAAAAKNIAKRSTSCAHANPRLNKEITAITVSSRTLASNPSPPFAVGPSYSSGHDAELRESTGIDAPLGRNRTFAFTLNR